MRALKKQLKQNLALIFSGTLLLACHAAMAETDFESQARLLRARVMNQEQKMDHTEHHAAPVDKVDKSLEFHGVFYGYLPCSDCNGVKTTLSLKQHDNYLLVTQPARESSREYYEKGKYTWDEESRTVTLTSRKDAAIHKYYIENEGTIIQINNDGSRMAGGQDRYTLRRSDTVKAREVHIH